MFLISPRFIGPFAKFGSLRSFIAWSKFNQAKIPLPQALRSHRFPNWGTVFAINDYVKIAFSLCLLLIGSPVLGALIKLEPSQCLRVIDSQLYPVDRLPEIRNAKDGNLNHPNDYLIRWYAQTVARLLLSR